MTVIKRPTRARTVVMESKAECHSCDWTHDGRGGPNAARHHAATTGHTVHVARVTSTLIDARRHDTTEQEPTGGER